MHMDFKTGKPLGDLMLLADAPHYQTGSGTPPRNPERAASASENDELFRILQSIAKISNLKFIAKVRLVHSTRVERWQMEEVLESGLGDRKSVV